MPDRRTLLICSCEDTMPLDAGAFERGCRGADIVSARQLCRAELERFRELLASGEPITVGCTQEAPLFREIAAESTSDVTFANIRESAGSACRRRQTANASSDDLRPGMNQTGDRGVSETDLVLQPM
jgi:hypothetical protein